MNRLMRAATISIIAFAGLTACGDDTKSPAPAATNPAPAAAEVMTDNTEVMMTDNTEAMTDSTSTAGG